ncbi:copper resistance CopC family protein [Gordonia sp. CPCC 205515]|uniref:copper resistance CopC family protein n=1 Tax=Gordonia sp. CPCC 205515 TaxID=3140791 RepID=UPI003AF33B10
MRPVVRRLSIMLIGVVVAVLAGAGTADAATHTDLLRSTPGRSATLYAAPITVTLTFDRPLLPDAWVTVRDNTGRSWQLGRATVRGATVAQRTSLYAGEGRYVVSYHARTWDGHRIDGRFTYRVKSV